MLSCLVFLVYFLGLALVETYVTVLPRNISLFIFSTFRTRFLRVSFYWCFISFLLRRFIVSSCQIVSDFSKLPHFRTQLIWTLSASFWSAHNFNRPGVAGAVLQTPSSLSDWSFSSQSWKPHYSLAVRARELKFWENVHSPPTFTFHVSCVTCHVSHVKYLIKKMWTKLWR